MGSIGREAAETTSFDWQAAVKKKQEARAQATPSEWLLSESFLSNLSMKKDSERLLQQDICRQSGKLNERELEITEAKSVDDLLELMGTGQVTSLEVTTAFCKRAAIAQQLLSCVTEVYYAEALQRATELDAYFQENQKPIGPLHGMPISVKDSFLVKGLQSTVGYSSLLAHPPATTNSPLVQMLVDMGAVLYVKTNIPQTMMTADSENNIFGRTLNPQNTNLTAGGSSGGEGSLVSFRGSILGIGTDIAGSIRIPALCCGIYGFKPTSSRVPYGGQVSGPMSGLPGLIASAGPLAHSLKDIEVFLWAMLSAPTDDYDSTAIAAPWRSVTPSKCLRIGLLPEEAVFPLQPPIRRALKAATKALEDAGHEIVPLSISDECSVSLANRLAFSYYILGPDSSQEHFGPGGEPMVKSVAARYNPMFSGPFPVDIDTEPLQKIDALHQARETYAENWRKLWVEQKIDVLLCPAAQNTAVPHDTYGWPPYTQIWNVLDYPACVIPYGKANKMLDPHAVQEDNFGPQPQYDPEAVDQAPCAIQVVTRRMRDEECLAAAKIIDECLKKFTPADTFGR